MKLNQSNDVMKTLHKFSLIISLLLVSYTIFAHNDFIIKVESLAKDKTTINQDIERAYQKLVLNTTNQQAPTIDDPSELMSLVEQYQYVDENNQRFLVVNFNKGAIQDFLANHKLTPIPNSNHTALLYVAQIVDGKKSLPNLETDPKLIEMIINQAKQNGLLLISPAMDLDDVSNIHFADIWQQKLPVLTAAAQRYNVKGILILKLSKSAEDHWQSDWHLLFKDKQCEAQVAEMTLTELSQQALQQLHQQLQSYAKIQQDIFIGVNHADSNKNYQLLFDILKKLPGVKQVQLDQVTPDSVLYKLSTNSGKDKIINRLKAHKHIIFQQEHDDGVIQIQVNS